MRHDVYKILAIGVLTLGTATALNAQGVISQVYGGGGLTGAPYKYDYIELFNQGSTFQNLTGWTVQTASAAGSVWTATPLLKDGNPITLQPGQYLLIQMQGALGAQGAELPPPDVIGVTIMTPSSYKVALVNSTALLSGVCPFSASIQDLVGYGVTASCWEGNGPTGTLSITTAALRNNGGCTDTNNNAADFTVGVPTPHNFASPFTSCIDLIFADGFEVP